MSTSLHLHAVPVLALSSPRARKKDKTAKVLSFLRGVGNNPEIKAALATRGYTDDEHLLGYKLLHTVDGHRQPAAVRDSTPTEMLDAVSAWLDPTLRCARGALERFYPEQASFVMEGLAAARGPEALLTATKFLDRLDALEGSPDRKSTRKADHHALALLATRGIDEKQRVLARKQVAAAETPATPADVRVITTVDEQERDVQAMLAWYADWSGTAHAVIKRRDLLIRIGLAHRISRKKAATAPTPQVPPAPIGTVTIHDAVLATPLPPAFSTPTKAPLLFGSSKVA